ncbi:hypothetical protein RSAG8_01401, partial [Rhizoctonia solani AG-8 WAC10335]
MSAHHCVNLKSDYGSQLTIGLAVKRNPNRNSSSSDL